MAYLRCFCAGDVDGLEPLFADDLCFEEPFRSYASAADYAADILLIFDGGGFGSMNSASRSGQ